MFKLPVLLREMKFRKQQVKFSKGLSNGIVTLNAMRLFPAIFQAEILSKNRSEIRKIEKFDESIHEVILNLFLSVEFLVSIYILTS